MRKWDFLTKKEEITDTPQSLYNWRKGLEIERDSIAQDNARDGDFSMRYVENFLIRPTEYFCDTLIQIYESNRFDRQTMLNKLPKDIKDKLIANHGDKWIEFDIEELKK
uniref:Uncharacterized protein n=1 Tax=Meloidogyne javanica TaxID=6303 RepID=A0A915MJY0_MELJA